MLLIIIWCALYFRPSKLEFYVMDIEKIVGVVVLADGDQLTVIFQRGAMWFKCIDPSCNQINSLSAESGNIYSTQRSIFINATQQTGGIYMARSDGVNSSTLSFSLVVKDLIKKRPDDASVLTLHSFVQLELNFDCVELRKSSAPYVFSTSLYERLYCISGRVLRINSVEWSDVGVYYSVDFQFSVIYIKEPVDITYDVALQVDFSAYSAVVLPPTSSKLCEWHVGTMVLKSKHAHLIYELKSGGILIEKYAGEVVCMADISKYAYKIKPIVVELSLSSDLEYFREGLPGTVNCQVTTSTNIMKLQIRSHLTIFKEITDDIRKISYTFDHECDNECSFICIAVYVSHSKLRTVEKNLTIPFFKYVKLEKADTEVKVEKHSRIVIDYENVNLPKGNLWWTVNKNILPSNVLITENEVYINNVTESNEGTYFVEIVSSSFNVVFVLQLLPMVHFDGALNNTLVIFLQKDEPTLVCRSSHPRLLSVSILGQNLVRGVFSDHSIATFPLRSQRNSGLYWCAVSFLSNSNTEESYKKSIMIIFTTVIAHDQHFLSGQSWALLNPSLFHLKTVWLMRNDTRNSQQNILSDSASFIIDSTRNLILQPSNPPVDVNISVILPERQYPINYTLIYNIPNITLIIHPSSSFVADGSQLDINCLVPEALRFYSFRLYWYKSVDAGSMFPSIQTIDSSIIYFSPAMLSDSGNYVCVFEYKLSETSDSHHYTRHHMLEVVPRMHVDIPVGAQIVAFLGQTLELNCVFKAEHLLSAVWKKNDSQIETKLENSQISHSIPVILSDHAGVYECVITNEVEEQNKSVNLTVEDSIAILPVESTEFYEVGDEVVIVCKFVVKLPALPTSRSLKNYNCDSCKLNVMESQDVLQLMIDHASIEDSGPYECKITSPYSEVKVRFNLIVLMPVQIQKFSNSSYLVEIFSKFELDCEYIGDDIQYARWINDDRNVISMDDDPISLRLQIKEVDENNAGRYTCEVANRLRTRSADIDLKVVGVTVKLINLSAAREVKRGSNQSFSCEIVIHNPYYNFTELVNTTIAIGQSGNDTVNWKITSEESKKIHLGVLNVMISKDMPDSILSCFALWKKGPFSENYQTTANTSLHIVEDPVFMQFRMQYNGKSSSVAALKCVVVGTHITKVVIRLPNGNVLLENRYSLSLEKIDRILEFNSSIVNISEQTLCTVTQQVNMESYEFNMPIEVIFMSVASSTYIAVGVFVGLLLVFLITGILIWRSCWINPEKTPSSLITF